MIMDLSRDICYCLAQSVVVGCEMLLLRIKIPTCKEHYLQCGVILMLTHCAHIVHMAAMSTGGSNIGPTLIQHRTCPGLSP